jgi:hypothetical protein
MNTANALGFFGFGALRWLLPAVAPGWFPPTGIDGSSARALWIQLMGVVQCAIGASFLLRGQVIPAVARWLAAARPVAVLTQAPVPQGAARVSPPVPFTLRSQQGGLLAAERLEPDRAVTFRGQHATLRRALQVTFLDQERLVHFFERLRLLAHRDRNRAHADRAAAVVLGEHPQHALVHFVQAGGVDLQQLEGGRGDGLRDAPLGAFLSEIAHKVDEVVGDTRRAA